MNIEQAKNIQLADYLKNLGYIPTKQQGDNLWYNSPFRQEKEASFKVNLSRNEWYDFGIGKGGNIIALAAIIYETEDVACLLQNIEKQLTVIPSASFSFRPSPISSGFQDLKVQSLNNTLLLQYLAERGINIEVAKRECRELHFTNNGKKYFAIGFSNVSGGYEVRNKYFKGCISPKDITHIKQEQPCKPCYLFEGFMDYLSFLTMQQKNVSQNGSTDKQDYLILNSVSNLSKAIGLLDKYERIYCLLDNDTAGKNTLQQLYKTYGSRVIDASVRYAEYKDLNDFLLRKKKNIIQSVPEQKQEVKPITPKKIGQRRRL